MEILHGTARSIKRKILQQALRSGKLMEWLNHRLADYLHIHSIVCREDLSLMVCFSINGMDQPVTVTVSDYSIAEDGSWICLGKAGSSIAGIDRALASFVQGKRIPIPEKYAGTAVSIKKFLL